MCRWHSVNFAKLGKKFRAVVFEERRLSLTLLESFFKHAALVEELGGTWSFEWPRGSYGWSIEKFQNWLSNRKVHYGIFDGCMFGVKSKAGRPIRKPWKVATNFRTLAEGLDKHRCNHQAADHDPCAGSETSKTENYTTRLAARVISLIEHRPPLDTSKEQNRALAGLQIHDQFG